MTTLENVKIIILAVIGVLAAYYAMTLPFLIIVLPIVGYSRVRLRGYTAPKAASLMLGVLLAAVLATIATAIVARSYLGTFAVVLLCTCVLTLSLALGCTALVRKLPKRTNRVSGPRKVRIPFFFLGYLTIAVGIAGAIAIPMLAPPQNRTVDNFIRLPAFLAVFILFGTLLIGIGRRVKNQKPFEFDGRSPVLFLRPFAAEGLPFVQGADSKYGRYSGETQKKSTAIRSMSDADGNQRDEDPTISIPFDVYFGPTFRERLGPFIALGNPEDYLPPEGATRTYFEDEDWFEYFQRMARQSVCTVMPISNSDNLQRELTFLRFEGLQQRLFILTPLWSPLNKTVPFPTRAANWIVSKLYGITRQRDYTEDWKDLTENLRKLDLHLEDDPGRGAVITFDSDGNAILLVRGADIPPDFVEPVREHLISTFGPDLSSPLPPTISPASPSSLGSDQTTHN